MEGRGQEGKRSHNQLIITVHRSCPVGRRRYGVVTSSFRVMICCIGKGRYILSRCFRRSSFLFVLNSDVLHSQSPLHLHPGLMFVSLPDISNMSAITVNSAFHTFGALLPDYPLLVAFARSLRGGDFKVSSISQSCQSNANGKPAQNQAYDWDEP